MRILENSLIFIGAAFIFAATPTSSTYKLESYGVGAGGTEGSSSSTYSTTAISGEQSGANGSTSSTYKSSGGFIPTLPASTPAAPTITNPTNYYNKLRIAISTGGTRLMRHLLSLSAQTHFHPQ